MLFICTDIGAYMMSLNSSVHAWSSTYFSIVTFVVFSLTIICISKTPKCNLSPYEVDSDTNMSSRFTPGDSVLNYGFSISHVLLTGICVLSPKSLYGTINRFSPNICAGQGICTRSGDKWLPIWVVIGNTFVYTKISSLFIVSKTASGRM